MNPLYKYYLVKKNVFLPDMEETHYKYKLDASSGGVSQNENYNTSPLVPISDYTKVVFDDKEVIVCFYDSQEEYISGYSGKNLDLIRPKNAVSISYCYTIKDWNSGDVSIDLMYQQSRYSKMIWQKHIPKNRDRNFSVRV